MKKRIAAMMIISIFAVSVAIIGCSSSQPAEKADDKKVEKKADKKAPAKAAPKKGK